MQAKVFFELTFVFYGAYTLFKSQNPGRAVLVWHWGNKSKGMDKNMKPCHSERALCLYMQK